MNYLYFIQNQSIPGLIKIGITGDPDKRLNSLYSTSVPEGFDVLALFCVNDTKSCEKAVHTVLEEYRTNKRREFFQIDIHAALTITKEIILEYVPHETSILNTQPSIDSIDLHILEMLVCAHEGQGYPTDLAHNTEESVQRTLLRLGSLEHRGYAKGKSADNPEWSAWSVTHKGRKYAFTHSGFLQSEY